MNYSHIRIILGAMKKRFKFLRIDYRSCVEKVFAWKKINFLWPIFSESSSDRKGKHSRLLNKVRVIKKIVLSVIFLSLAKRKPFYLLIGISFDARNFFPHGWKEIDMKTNQTRKSYTSFELSSLIYASISQIVHGQILRRIISYDPSQRA